MSKRAECWVYGGIIGSTIHDCEKNLLYKAASLCEENGFKLCFFLCTKNISEELYDVLKQCGVKKVYFIKSGHARVSYNTQLEIIIPIIQKEQPEIILFPCTDSGRFISAYLSVKLQTGLTADCIQLEYDSGEGQLLQTRRVNMSEMVQVVTPNRRPQLATVLFQKVYESLLIDPSERLEIVEKEAPLEESSTPYSDLQVQCISKKYSFINKDIVLVGGAGLGSKSNFLQLYKLADLLSAGVGATRRAVDLGFAEKEQLIGMSGKIISSQICIEFGVSGASQHLIGIESCQNLYVVNKDEDAPICSCAQGIIVNDVNEVIQTLIHELSTI